MSTASLTGSLNIPNGSDAGQPTYYAATGIISVNGVSTERGNADGHGGGGNLTINATHEHNVTISDTGDGTPHNNMQPYIAICIFKRIS